jgi:hypothetical protein
MPPEPDEQLAPTGFDDLPWFSGTWQNLPWSPWVPFAADKEAWKQIPNEPGLCRIRPAGKDFLMYIGETGRLLYRRMSELRQNLRRTDLMPWNDPDTSAPALWAWRDAEGFAYECSAAPLDASPACRRAMESFLLYRYRQEYGESPLCNFGRFHPRYRRSSDRKENRRGGRLRADQQDNPAGGPSAFPLRPAGLPGDEAWMGIPWSKRTILAKENIPAVPAAPGLCILSDAATSVVVTIGQAMDCRARLEELEEKNRAKGEILFACHIPATPVLPHMLREPENDLIGNYFEHFRRAPAFPAATDEPDADR